MSVVVQDKKGNPITGLKKEDVTVLYEGGYQSVLVEGSIPCLTHGLGSMQEGGSRKTGSLGKYLLGLS
jgi:hypothetical protein